LEEIQGQLYCGIQRNKLADCNRHKPAEKNGQEGAKVAERQNSDNSDKKKCYRCKEKEHIAKKCPTRKKNQADTFFVGVTLSKEEADRDGTANAKQTARTTQRGADREFECQCTTAADIVWKYQNSHGTERGS